MIVLPIVLELLTFFLSLRLPPSCLSAGRTVVDIGTHQLRRDVVDDR